MAAGIGVAVCFALGVLGVIRFAELRDEERPALAGLHAMLGVAGVAVAATAVVAGVILVD
jgi:hypothetical protein